jgi:hypothetical protein
VDEAKRNGGTERAGETKGCGTSVAAASLAAAGTRRLVPTTSFGLSRNSDMWDINYRSCLGVLLLCLVNMDPQAPIYYIYI